MPSETRQKGKNYTGVVSREGSLKHINEKDGK